MGSFIFKNFFDPLKSFVIFLFLLTVILCNETLRIVVLLLQPFPNFKFVSGGREGYFYCLSNHGAGTAIDLVISEQSESICLKQETEHFEKRVLRQFCFQNLKYILKAKLGYLVYEQDCFFDVSKHVRVWDNKIISKEDLMECILPALHAPFSDDKPQWEWIVLPRVQLNVSKGGFETVRILRKHESYTYGFGAYEIIYSLIDWDTPNHLPQYIFNPWKDSSKREKLSLIFQVLRSLRLLPSLVLRLTKNAQTNIGLTSEAKPNHGFFFSASFPVSTLKAARVIARNALERRSVDSLLATAFKTCIGKLPRSDSSNEYCTMSVNLIPSFSSQYPDNVLQDNCFWILNSWKVGPQLVTVRKTEKDLASWVFDMVLERMPIFLQEYVLKRDSPVSATLVNLPLVRSEGCFLGKTVSKVLSFTPEPSPIGLGIILITYKDECILCCTASQNVISKDDVKTVLNQMVIELDKFRKQNIQ